MNKKVMTICCVYDDTRILLGEIIKEGKLKGMFNGFGGKVEEGETIEAAAKRELFEEVGIKPLDLKKRGIISFTFDPGQNPFGEGLIMEVHIFSVTKFEGEPTESREMRPQWFLHQDVPYNKMWPDDQYWLPLIFSEKNFEGTFHLKNSKEIADYTLNEVEN